MITFLSLSSWYAACCKTYENPRPPRMLFLDPGWFQLPGFTFVQMYTNVLIQSCWQDNKIILTTTGHVWDTCPMCKEGSNPRRPVSYNAGYLTACSSVTSRSKRPVAMTGQKRIMLNDVQTVLVNMPQSTPRDDVSNPLKLDGMLPSNMFLNSQKRRCSKRAAS